eukprot:c26533_g1_i1.p1 GENE.c26533_g1_i1~~c26533_g1_i1.p1  ORF type:complete len:189 (-),score=32.62 c26533_g1_i1:60-596(-)
MDIEGGSRVFGSKMPSFKRGGDARKTSPLAGCLTVICACIWIPVLIGVGLSPFALGGFEAWLYHKKHDVHCGKPLAKWVLAICIWHFLFAFEEICCRSANARRGENKAKKIRPEQLPFQLAGTALIIIGAVYVYNLDRDNCDHLLYDYCWYFVTVTFCIVAACIAFGCCFGFYFAFTR